MNSKRQNSRQPLFAEVKLDGAPSSPHLDAIEHAGRPRFMKLYYPNGVMLMLPGDIPPSQLEQYVRIKV